MGKKWHTFGWDVMCVGKNSNILISLQTNAADGITVWDLLAVFGCRGLN